MPATRPTSSPDPRADHHVHTRFCGHASGEMEEYVQAAITRGLRKIVFLEHMEEGIVSPYRTWLSEDDFDRYFAEGRRLRQVYGARIEIGLGVECGYSEGQGEALRARLAARVWDQIGISCHFLSLAGEEEHLNTFSRRAGNVERAMRFAPEILLDRYFSILHEAVRLLPGTMLCHLDGALRHVPGIALTAGHYLAIDAILQTVRDKGMALELNTSGFSIRGEPFPTRRILLMAQGYGIPLLLGSDAHQPGEVGRRFADIGDFVS